MRPRKRGSPFAGVWALQAFPNPSQTFPNLGPFTPNISKDSFRCFVRTQCLARVKMKFRFAPNFCADPVRAPRSSPDYNAGLAENIDERVARFSFFRNAILESSTIPWLMPLDGAPINGKPNDAAQ
jgi:hypothetical protein